MISIAQGLKTDRSPFKKRGVGVKPSLPHTDPSIAGSMVPIDPPSQSMVPLSSTDQIFGLQSVYRYRGKKIAPELIGG